MMQYCRKNNKMKIRLTRMKSRSGFWDISGVTLTADWKTRIELTGIELTRVPVRIPILSTDILSDATLVGILVLPTANMTMTNNGSLY